MSRLHAGIKRVHSIDVQWAVSSSNSYEHGLLLVICQYDSCKGMPVGQL